MKKRQTKSFSLLLPYVYISRIWGNLRLTKCDSVRGQYVLPGIPGLPINQCIVIIINEFRYTSLETLARQVNEIGLKKANRSPTMHYTPLKYGALYPAGKVDQFLDKFQTWYI